MFKKMTTKKMIISEQKHEQAKGVFEMEAPIKGKIISVKHRKKDKELMQTIAQLEKLQTRIITEVRERIPRKKRREFLVCLLCTLAYLGSSSTGIIFLLPHVDFSNNDALRTMPMYKNKTCSQALESYIKDRADNNIPCYDSEYSKKADFYEIWTVCSGVLRSHCSTANNNTLFVSLIFFTALLLCAAALFLNAIRYKYRHKHQYKFEEDVPELDAKFFKDADCAFLISQSIEYQSRNTCDIVMSIESRLQELKIMELLPLPKTLAELVTGYLDKNKPNYIEESPNDLVIGMLQI